MSVEQSNDIPIPLKTIGLLDNICVTSITELIQLLPQLLIGSAPSTITNVVVGPNQPTSAQRDAVWFRTNNVPQFLGIYMFLEGEWTIVYPYENPVLWVYGNSTEIGNGYVLVDENIPTSQIDSTTRAYIMSQYKTHSSGSYYTYFAVTLAGA